jgi:hypothetical protein
MLMFTMTSCVVAADSENGRGRRRSHGTPLACGSRGLPLAARLGNLGKAPRGVMTTTGQLDDAPGSRPLGSW